MTVIQLIVFIACLALVTSIVDQLPIRQGFKNIIYGVAVLTILIVVLNMVGLLPNVLNMRIGR